ncbi:hypothetical protein BDR03DRAFT_84270 [Suillus americanus]|nr:hypothetical protein BDR03DRAFT_84270 [Suillus americanus]
MSLITYLKKCSWRHQMRHQENAPGESGYNVDESKLRGIVVCLNVVYIVGFSLIAFFTARHEHSILAHDRGRL